MSTAVEPSPSVRTVPPLSGVQHLGLTVRDVAASEAWYAEVLGLVRAFVEEHPAGDGYAVVMTRPGSGLFVGLHHHPGANQELFTPQRTGLDHLAIQLPSRADIDEWITYLDAIGVEHEAVVERTEPAQYALVLVCDPDGIPIELFWIGG